MSTRKRTASSNSPLASSQESIATLDAASGSPPETPEEAPLSPSLANIPPPSPSTCLAYGCKKAARKFRTLCNAHQKQREKKGFIQLYNGQVSYVHHKQHHRQLIQEHRQNQQNSNDSSSASAVPNGDQPKRNKRGRPRKHPLPDSIENSLISEADYINVVPAIKNRPTRSTRKNTRYYDSEELDLDDFDDELGDEEDHDQDEETLEEEYQQDHDDTENEDNSSGAEDSQLPLEEAMDEEYELQELETEDPHSSYTHHLRHATQRLDTYRRKIRSSASAANHARSYTEEDEVGLLSFLINSATTSPVIPSASAHNGSLNPQQLQQRLRGIPSNFKYHLQDDGTLKKRRTDSINSPSQGDAVGDEQQAITTQESTNPSDLASTPPATKSAPPPSAFAEILASMSNNLLKGDVVPNQGTDDQEVREVPNSDLRDSENTGTEIAAANGKAIGRDQREADFHVTPNSTAPSSNAGVCGTKSYIQAPPGSTSSEPTPILSM